MQEASQPPFDRRCGIGLGSVWHTTREPLPAPDSTTKPKYPLTVGGTSNTTNYMTLLFLPYNFSDKPNI